jgi:DNA modification methylase
MQLIHGDCLEKMKDIPDKSIDMILCDLPYGTTKCKWDIVIPFDKLWEQYNRIIKDKGAILLFGSEPFSSKLRISNLRMYKYDWIWKKTKAQGFLNSKKMPLNDYENICVFYKRLPVYNPQGIIYGNFQNDRKSKYNKGEDIYGKEKEFGISHMSNFPKQIIEFSNPSGKGQLHPTQKPIKLLEYLLMTYSLENETVLDNCMGSGSTGIACVNTKRNFIGIEKDAHYFEIARNRIEEHITTASTQNDEEDDDAGSGALD